MRLLQSWRWFGPNDPVTLTDIRQTGATGIVTALHHMPYGEIWPVEQIRARQDEIRAAGRNGSTLDWAVIESLTVHESIKTRTGPYQQYIDKYKQSLRNIAECGLKIVTYNFMPVNDWTRTNLDYTMPDGSKALYFNWFDLAVFDIHMLRRPNAADNYPAYVVAEAEQRYARYTEAEREHLAGVVMFGIPGEERQTIPKMRDKLALYNDIDHAALRSNLIDFLREITPVADELGIRMAIHPDDPPFDILGLPRIACRADDFAQLLSAVPNESNGVCFCTGSLGANPTNDLVEMAKQIGTKIHFVHLRNVKKDEHGNFFEDDHLGGDVDMYGVMREILRIQQQVAEPIPFRPDHGHQMLDDLHKTTNPGYSCIGRMRGLAELRGLELGICRAEGW
ncbi:mannonate dehydratase [Spirosoma montaniterrae]|uniref:Mannonate dehydratase n=1 Tax=Spirosoma montaniterrae TaxID=1178516 RepID=A0A1P9WZ14_9BACT|nr:mannonate dehydratase [Spirosoma montaniterrae]AQG80615.1 mannonate dehydratase [Spirosoma montaniterrae]